jgi:TatD DNase family protein
MILFDTHAHLDGEEYATDREEMIARARSAGVVHIVNVGFNLESSRRSVRLAEEYDLIYAAVGIHPHDAAEAGPGYLEELKEMAAHPRVVALGEMGLDYYRDLSPRPVQQKIFREQLALARELELPFIIHDREAHGDLMKILRENRPGPSGGVLHCYSGSWEMARECLALGLYLSIAGPVTYSNANRLKEIVTRVPLDRLLIETDAPYLSPAPYRGKRNEPAYVACTAEEIARLRCLKTEDLAKACTENGRKLFRIA